MRLSKQIDEKDVDELVSEISEHYIIHDVLGRGSFGIVYKAIHRQSGEAFAVKIVDIHSTAPEKFAALLHEVGIMKRLRHRNLVQLKRVLRTDAHLYIVMELCESELKDWLVDGRPSLSEKDVCTVMRQLFDGVAYMHSQRIAHRDLKPQNILLVSRDLGTVKVSDFGLSCRVDTDTLLGAAVGTPAFMAPEVASPDSVYSEKCDVWSLGVIMFSLLTGTLPFKAATRDELFARICAGVYELPTTVPVSERARGLLAKLLLVDPFQRYAADEALHHPWFTGAAPGEGVQTIFEMLAAFKAGARWRLALNAVWVTVHLRRRSAARGAPAAAAAATAAAAAAAVAAAAVSVTAATAATSGAAAEQQGERPARALRRSSSDVSSENDSGGARVRRVISATLAVVSEGGADDRSSTGSAAAGSDRSRSRGAGSRPSSSLAGGGSGQEVPSYMRETKASSRLKGQGQATERPKRR